MIFDEIFVFDELVLFFIPIRFLLGYGPRYIRQNLMLYFAQNSSFECELNLVLFVCLRLLFMEISKYIMVHHEDTFCITNILLVILYYIEIVLFMM